MGWIDLFKRTSTVEGVAQAFGLKPGRLGSLGPCPACNADRRGSADSRGPIGVAKDRRGWRCFLCDAHGDALDIAARVVLQREIAGASPEDWEKLKTELIRASLLDERDAEADSRPSAHARVASFADTVQAMTGARRTIRASKPIQAGEPEPDKPDPGGRFAWDEGLDERAVSALWSPFAGDDSPAARARKYLTEVRRLPERSIQAFSIGLYVDTAGKPVLDDAGRPVLTIPLRDMAERTVNIRFRSVPVPGTCSNCTSVAGCRKCKGYRVCSGRPLPLFGADKLPNDLGTWILVTEGELDVVALHAYGYETGVVSGTGGAKTWKDEWLDVLEPYAGFVGLYDQDDAGSDGWEAVSEKLGRDRCSRVELPEKDAGDCLANGIPKHAIERAVRDARSSVGVAILRADAFFEEIEQLAANPERTMGIQTGWGELDMVWGGVRPGLIVVSGETGQGKAQPIDEPVLTPSGWRPIGSIRKGDRVIGSGGCPIRVKEVFPQGERDVVSVKFEDGAETRCDTDHLWAVASDLDVYRKRPWRVMKASDVATSVRSCASRNANRWRVPTCLPVSFAPETMDLPVDPYILGVLIGDGSLTNTGVRFTNPDEDLFREVEAVLPESLELRRVPTRSKAMNCSIVSRRLGDRNPISGALTALGLRTKSVDKSIPEPYLWASVAQRTALLQGLLDTDGWVLPSGTPAFSTSSERMYEQVVHLVRSLGGFADARSKTPKFTYKGEKRTGHRSWTLTIYLPPDIVPFRMERKRSLAKPRMAPRKIASVEPAGRAECVCLSVEADDGLYLTRDFILTHNTTWTTALLDNLSRRGVPCMLTSFEQRPIGTVQKLMRLQLGHSNPKRLVEVNGNFLKLTSDERRDLLVGIADRPLYVLNHYGHLTAAQVIDLAKFAARRHGVKVTLIDHLGFLVDPDAKDERRAIETVIRALALVATSFDHTFLLVVHPANTPRSPDGRAVELQPRDLKGASAIRQDAAEILFVEANKVTDKHPHPSSKIRLAKVRSEFGLSGASVTLAFDAAACAYADTWDELPSAQDGKLIPRTSPR